MSATTPLRFTVNDTLGQNHTYATCTSINAASQAICVAELGHNRGEGGLGAAGRDTS